MVTWKKTVHMLVLSALFVASSNSYAKDSGVIPDSKWNEARSVAQRSNDTFVLLGAEIALQKGQAGVALATYMEMLNRTRDPEVAERAMDMAISLQAHAQAEQIYQRWLSLSPNPTPELKRITLVRNLISNRIPEAAKDFDEVFNTSETIQKRRLFLLIAQSAVRDIKVAQVFHSSVHRQAVKEKDIAEAAVADAILSAMVNKQSDAIEALQRLAKMDSQISPATALTISLIARNQPETLIKFYEQTDTKNLSTVWRQAHVESLILAKQNKQAAIVLDELLSEQPTAELLLQATLLASVNQEPRDKILNYFNKAYQSGTQEQQSQVAFFAAMYEADNKQISTAREWLAKVKTSSYLFDKTVLQIALDVEEKKWTQARALLKQANALSTQQGRFFTSKDLFRLELPILNGELETAQNKTSHLNRLNELIAILEKNQDIETLSSALYVRAIIYADDLRQPELAIADLKRYLTYKPDSTAGMNALGYTMLSLPHTNLDEALNLIQTAYNQAPQDAAINDSLGWAYFLKGDLQAALPYIEYAYQKDGSPEVCAHYGEILWQLGEKERAMTLFQEGMKKSGNKYILEQTLKRLGVPASRLKIKPAK